MAAKKKSSQAEDNLELIENSLGKTEQYIEENQKSITIIIAAIVLIVGGYLAYQKFYIAPKEQEAQKEVFMAQNCFAQDSFRLALNGDGFNDGFLNIADQYSMTKVGNLCNYYIGISYLRLGQFDDAIEYLDKFDGSDMLVTTMAIGAIGDAYVEKDDLESAISYYKKAAERQANDFTSPLFLMKLGLTYEKLGNKEDALKAYEKIKTDFVKSNEAKRIQKYIERVKL